MTDIDPTPGTPVTLATRLGWWRGEAREQFSRLIGATPTSLYDVFVAISGVASGVRGQMSGSEGNTVADICRYLAGMSADIADMRARVEAVEAVLGAGEYSSTETANIRALLMSLLTQAGTVGVLPDMDTRTPLYSAGTATASGKRYVLWAGNASMAPDTSGRYLTPTWGWSGWQVYIQTGAPSATMQDVTDESQSIAEFPTNSWCDLAGNHALGWYVDSRYDVRGYIRGADDHSGYPIQQCATSYGQMMTIAGYGERLIVNWDISMSPTNRDGYGNIFSGNGFAVGDYIGSKVVMLAGEGRLCAFNGNSIVRQANVGNSQYVIDVNTTGLYMDNFGTNSGIMTVRVCPPWA